MAVAGIPTAMMGLLVHRRSRKGKANMQNITAHTSPPSGTRTNPASGANGPASRAKVETTRQKENRSYPEPAGFRNHIENRRVREARPHENRRCRGFFLLDNILAALKIHCEVDPGDVHCVLRRVWCAL